VSETRPTRLSEDGSGGPQVHPQQNNKPAKKRSDGFIESQTLNGSQINYARLLIEKTNQLRETPMRKVWPWAKYCCCCCLSKKKRSFKSGLKRSLRNRLDVKNLK